MFYFQRKRGEIMGIGTQTKAEMFEAGKRLRECREMRGLSRAQLIEAVELLPDNRGKDRSEKQLSYLENGTRALSLEYASLLAQVLHIRVEYLLLKDNYKTEDERIGASVTNRTEKKDLIMELMRLHGYSIKDATLEMPVHADADGKEYRTVTISITSPWGTVKYLSHKEFVLLLSEIDDYIEYKCISQTKKLIDGVKNLYKWG